MYDQAEVNDLKCKLVLREGVDVSQYYLHTIWEYVVFVCFCPVFVCPRSQRPRAVKLCFLVAICCNRHERTSPWSSIIYMS